MAVIFLKDRRPLTKEQKKMAETVLNNEINDVMANVEIIEEELDRTFAFQGLTLRDVVLRYLKQRVKRNPDGSIDEKVLQEVYRWYFPE
jgi:hypothetical protein